MSFCAPLISPSSVRRLPDEATEPDTAFTTCQREDLELVFALHYERIVARDNTVEYGNRLLQIALGVITSLARRCRQRQQPVLNRQRKPRDERCSSE
jgi:hypothetical protein